MFSCVLAVILKFKIQPPLAQLVDPDTKTLVTRALCVFQRIVNALSTGT